MGKRVGVKKIDNIQPKIPVILFEEGNKIVAYSPAIDLSTCGDTEEQARKRFVEAASIFFDEITRMGTVDDGMGEGRRPKNPGKDNLVPPKYKSCTEEIVPISQGAN